MSVYAVVSTNITCAVICVAWLIGADRRNYSFATILRQKLSGQLLNRFGDEIVRSARNLGA